MAEPALLHVLGGGPWQVPTIKKAKAMGLRVLVTDMFAHRPAFAFADFHEQASIVDLPATLEIARRHRVNGIICDTTDVGVMTAAAVAEELGLPGIGTAAARCCTRKDFMRSVTAAAGCAAPNWFVGDSPHEFRESRPRLGFPVVVKPVDGQSGCGVSRVARPDDLDAAFDLAKAFSRAGPILVEEFIEGTEYIVDGFVVDSAPLILGVAAKVPYEENVTIASRITYDAALSAETRRQIATANRCALQSIGLAHGVFHAEYRVSGERVVPIDIAARGGGVMIYTHVIPAISGVDAVAEQIRFALGMPPQFTTAPRRRSANIEFFRIRDGSLRRIDGVDEATSMPGIIALHVSAEPGATQRTLQRKDDRPGFIIGVGDTAGDAISFCLAAKARLRAHLVEHDDPVPVD